MIPNGVTRLVVLFDESAAPRSLEQLLGALGLSLEGDRRVRVHQSGVVTCRTESTPDPALLRQLSAREGVRKIVQLPPGQYLIDCVNPDADRTVTLPNGARIGGGQPVVIAGPCSVESVEQVCRIAATVKDAGALALRGGAFKPRTSPYSFGGLGEAGLRALTAARDLTGLPVVTEVLDTTELDLVASHADVVQIGSRNMFNFPLLYKAGRHDAGKPVLLKRGFGATVDEFLEAAEYIQLGRLAAGHESPGLILCERGIRTFEQSTRFTLDVGAIPILKDRSGLPVIADPSHPAGLRKYVLPLAAAAIASGADGLLVEVHFDPTHAWCDGDQSLNMEEFAALVDRINRIAAITP